MWGFDQSLYSLVHSKKVGRATTYTVNAHGSAELWTPHAPTAQPPTAPTTDPAPGRRPFLRPNSGHQSRRSRQRPIRTGQWLRRTIRCRVSYWGEQGEVPARCSEVGPAGRKSVGPAARRLLVPVGHKLAPPALAYSRGYRGRHDCPAPVVRPDTEARAQPLQKVKEPQSPLGSFPLSGSPSTYPYLDWVCS